MVGLPATISLPTFTPTNTLTPTVTFTPTITTTPTTTPCKVPPVVNIVEPAHGGVYTTSLPGQATAYDPDNADPALCAGVGADGEGITTVVFQISWWNGSNWEEVYSHSEGAVAYCTFGGAAPCPEYDLTTVWWPSGHLINDGLHRMRANAQDDEGVWSGWQEVQFYINPLATETPTATPTPSCLGVNFGTFRFDNYGRVSQRITNTTYPGLAVVSVTFDWGPLNQASNLYSWNERLDYMNWNATAINNGNDYTSTTSSNVNMPRNVSIGGRRQRNLH